MVTRINGFSGMDIDSLVKNMMATKRVPLDKTSQSKDLLQWQRESYREINSKLYDFRNNKLSLTGYRSSSALNTQTAVIKDNSGIIVESANSPVKATATATANGIPMKVSVAQTATAASLKVDSALGSGYKSSQTLQEIMTQTYKKNNPADTTLSGLTVPDTFELSLKVNGEEKTISFAKGTTLSSAMTQINSDASLNVKASFDDITGQFKFDLNTTGYTVPPELPKSVEVGSAANSFLKLMSQNGSGNATSIKGQNAIFSINDTVLNSQTNTVVYNGVELKFEGITGVRPTIKEADGVTDKVDASGNKVYDFSTPLPSDKAMNITTTVDTAKALESVKAFVSDYNNMIASFNNLVNEEKYKDFPPLTSEQRSAMSESDITAWEKKAKSGLLKNDSILKSVVSDLRSVIQEQLGPLSSMGITTGGYFENGKLYIDEAKFKKAVEANPEQLVTTLQGTATNTKDSVFGKFVSSMDDAMGKIAERAGTSKFDGSLTATFKAESVMGRQLKQYTNRISLLTTQLNDAETRYYKQFSAMEASMNKYQSQLSQLTGASK